MQCVHACTYMYRRACVRTSVCLSGPFVGKGICINTSDALDGATCPRESLGGVRSPVLFPASHQHTLSQARFLLLLAAQGPGLKAHWFSNVQSTHFHAFLQNVVSPELRFFSLVHFLVSRGYNLPTSEGVITMYRCQRSSPRDLPELGEGPPTLQESTPRPPPLGLLLELTPCSPAITKSQFFEELIGQVTNS